MTKLVNLVHYSRPRNWLIKILTSMKITVTVLKLYTDLEASWAVSVGGPESGTVRTAGWRGHSESGNTPGVATAWTDSSPGCLHISQGTQAT